MTNSSVLEVPRFIKLDVHDEAWKNHASGPVALAMAMNFHHPRRVGGKFIINELITEGLHKGYFHPDKGWSCEGLIKLSEYYGFIGKCFDFPAEEGRGAIKLMNALLAHTPIIVPINRVSKSRQYILVKMIDGPERRRVVHYNDPSADTRSYAARRIPLHDFTANWNKKFLVVALKNHKEIRNILEKTGNA